MMQSALKFAALKILRPFVRYLVEQGWTYGMLTELLKFVYVTEVLANDRRSGNANPTDSRVSLLSGIHRKEVRRIREELAASPGDIQLREDANIAAQIIATWLSCADYQDVAGIPRVLSLRASDHVPGFDALVTRVKADMRPRTILDELLRTGVVSVDNDKVTLVRHGYVSDLQEDGLAFMADHISDHLQATTHNLRGDTPAYFEQSVYFDQLPPHLLEQIRSELRALSEKTLQQAYRSVIKSKNSDVTILADTVDNGLKRMRLGIYYFEDEAHVKSARSGDDHA